jgi:hypothetical protein
LNTFDNLESLASVRAKINSTIVKVDELDITVGKFGAVGDGVTDDTAAILAANASGLGPFDLGGGVFATTIAPTSLSMVAYNGTIWAVNADGNREQYRPQSVFYDYQIKSRSTKARVTDWKGKKLLWLGTSIPQFGLGDGSYPEIFASALGCSVTNNAFAGSRARWEGLSGIDPTGNIVQVRNLSMTAADVAAGLALYGPGSVFDDTYDVITLASQMTCDFRIGNVFAAGQVDVVFLDHNHNDRRAPWGAPSTVSSSISSATFGATTAITVANGSLFAAGDGVGLTSTGVARFAFAAGRVQSVVGNVVTIAYNTTALTGSVTGGVLYKLDRSTIHGAWDFLIYFIKGQAAFYGYTQPQIILCSAPSEWTNNTLNNDIWANGEAIKRVADFWSLPFFDVSTEYRVTEKDHTTYFSDNVHPATRPERQALANLWVAWAEGGYPKRLNETDYLPASGSPFADQTIAVYSAVRGAFVAPTQIAGAYSTVLSEDFSGGLGAYTSVGASPAPTVTTAPWDAGDDALYAVVSSTQSECYVHRNLSMTKANRLSFDFWLPEVVGLTTGAPKVITLIRTRSTNQHMLLRVVIRAERTTLQVVYFAEPAAVFTQPPGATISLSADTKYRVSLEYVTDDGNSTGGFRVLLDGVEIIPPTATVDSAHGAATRVDVGLIGSSLADDFEIYIGNLLVESRAVATPFSGTVSSPASVTVVNGIVTAVS